ncbi:MAG: type II toxin-antitoxin system HipA family toxin, partial [Desulfobacterales bacterium]|nr:type II toxin-antitoxin system HipA family toxin [Desulfobacterales bacterium]
MKRLTVVQDNARVGELWLDRRRRFVFRYDEKYLERRNARPLSLSLPLREAPFEKDAARPFFSNLLPEGDIRDTIARHHHVSPKNDFALLEKIGGECAGAVSILPEGARAETGEGYLPISPDELDEMIATRPRGPLLTAREESRLSLAGAQDKLPVFIKDGEFFLTMGARPSSHILKPRNRYFEDMIQNEAFCMALAKSVGLPAPDAFIWKGERNIAYVVERYDRKMHEDGTVSRLHQEDFCQAMGLSPDQKYESEGGPGLIDCFALLQKNSAHPLRDRKRLMEWVIFNYLIGGADAHAKNISLLYLSGKIVLAPFYDLVSTLVYPGLTSKMSMKIGKENRFKWLQERHWTRFALGIDVKPGFLFSTAAAMSKKAIKKAGGIGRRITSRFGGEST